MISLSFLKEPEIEAQSFAISEGCLWDCFEGITKAHIRYMTVDQSLEIRNQDENN